MEWLAEKRFFVLLLVAFVALHLFGHCGHSSHGVHGRSDDEAPRGRDNSH